MADSKEQKTALLTDAPAEVQAALQKRSAEPSAGQHNQGGGAGPATLIAESAAPYRGASRPLAAQKGREPSPVKAAPPSGGWRWVAGPLLSLAVAAATFTVAHLMAASRPKPPPTPPKVMGQVRLQTVPTSASMTINGKAFPHFTPTVVDGEVGTTLNVVFHAEGFQAKEVEVYVGEGEHPITVKLEPLVAPPPAPVEPPPAPRPEPPKREVVRPPSTPKAKEHHHESGKSKDSSAVDKVSISVFVRPWAIVFVDGSRLRQTPIESYELSAGRHKIELVNDSKSRHETISIVLKSGQPQEIRRDWDK